MHLITYLMMSKDHASLVLPIPHIPVDNICKPLWFCDELDIEAGTV